MLTGKLAFYAPSVPTAMFKVCYEEPAPIRDLVSNLPDGLAEVLAKALAKSKHDRYASARALGDDLDRVFQGHQATFETGVAHKVLTDPMAPGPRPSGPTTMGGAASQVMQATTIPPPPRSNTLAYIIAAVGIVAVIGAAILVYFVTQGRRDQGKGPPAQVAAMGAEPKESDTRRPPESSEVVLTFYVMPKGATLTLDGKEVEAGMGSIKRVITMPRGEEPIAVKVTAKGYGPRDGTVLPVQDQTVNINLFKEGVTPPPEVKDSGFEAKPSGRRPIRRGMTGTTGSGMTEPVEPPSRTRPTDMIEGAMMAPPPRDMRPNRKGGAAADTI